MFICCERALFLFSFITKEQYELSGLNLLEVPRHDGWQQGRQQGAGAGVKLPSSHEIPETEFCVYGKVYAHPQHADALARVYEETTRLSASEPGVIYYCISRESEDTRVFHFFERYTGREAFEAHNCQPIIRKLVEEDGYIERVEAVFAKPLA